MLGDKNLTMAAVIDDLLACNGLTLETAADAEDLQAFLGLLFCVMPFVGFPRFVLMFGWLKQ